MQYLTIEIPVRLWQLIHGCVDNSTSVDMVDGVIETVAVGSCVRDAGWREAAAVAGDASSYGWPPEDSTLRITLRRGHWGWAVSQLDRWEPYEAARHEDFQAARVLIRSSLAEE